MRKFGTVKNGSTGTDVIVLQTVLRLMMFLGKDGKQINIDGECGSNTVYAIKEFQKKAVATGHKIRTDGTWDISCWELIGV